MNTWRIYQSLFFSPKALWQGDKKDFGWTILFLASCECWVTLHQSLRIQSHERYRDSSSQTGTKPLRRGHERRFTVLWLEKTSTRYNWMTNLRQRPLFLVVPHYKERPGAALHQSIPQKTHSTLLKWLKMHYASPVSMVTMLKVVRVRLYAWVCAGPVLWGALWLHWVNQTIDQRRVKVSFLTSRMEIIHPVYFASYQLGKLFI